MSLGKGLWRESLSSVVLHSFFFCKLFPYGYRVEDSRDIHFRSFFSFFFFFPLPTDMGTPVCLPLGSSSNLLLLQYINKH